MSGTDIHEALALRARADELRRVAIRLEACRAMTLQVEADEATWRGPGPELCRRLLAGNLHQLRLAAEELRRRAAWSDQQAADVERRALLRSVTG